MIGFKENLAKPSTTQKREWVQSQGVVGLGEELLTQTGDFVEPWKKHFDDHLNQVTKSTFEKTKSKDLGRDEFIAMAEIIEVAKKLLIRSEQHSL